MEPQKNNVLPLVLLAVGIILGFAGGYFLGTKAPKEEARNANLQELVDAAYPKPPEDIRTVNAKITKIDGTRIEFETNDPEDYLPHSDGSAPYTMTRVARVTDATEIWLLSPTKIDANGNVSKKKLKITDLKAGEMVAITASENVRTAKEFDTLLIEKVEY
jgi:hypothetical protein